MKKVISEDELSKIIETANNTIKQFEELVNEIVENKSNDDDTTFYGVHYEYNFYGEAIDDFASEIFKMIGENLSKRKIDCDEDGDGYIIQTNTGKKVILLVFDTNVIDIIAIPLEKASFCNIAEA